MHVVRYWSDILSGGDKSSTAVESVQLLLRLHASLTPLSCLQVDRILDLLFMVYVPRFEADKLVELMAFLNKLFFASADVWYQSTVRKLDSSLKRYYIVHALQKGRPDRVLDFYERYGESLLRTGEDWHAWFGTSCLSLVMVPEFLGHLYLSW